MLRQDYDCGRRVLLMQARYRWQDLKVLATCVAGAGLGQTQI